MQVMTVSQIRMRNIAAIIAAIDGSDAVTRSDLAQYAGLSVMSIGNILASLQESEAIVEEKTRRGIRGRDPSIVSFNKQHWMTGISVDSDAMYGAVYTMDMRLVESRRIPMKDADPEQAFASMLKRLNRIAAKAGLEDGDLIGLGLGIPGIYDLTTDTVTAPFFPALEALRPASVAAINFDGDISVFPAAVCGGAEYGSDSHSMLYIHVSDTLSQSVYLDGLPYDGYGGYAGLCSGLLLGGRPANEVLCKAIDDVKEAAGARRVGETVWTSDAAPYMEAYADALAEFLLPGCALIAPEKVVADIGVPGNAGMAAALRERLHDMLPKLPEIVTVSSAEEDIASGAARLLRNRWIMSLH